MSRLRSVPALTECARRAIHDQVYSVVTTADLTSSMRAFISAITEAGVVYPDEALRDIYMVTVEVVVSCDWTASAYSVIEEEVVVEAIIDELCMVDTVSELPYFDAASIANAAMLAYSKHPVLTTLLPDNPETVFTPDTPVTTVCGWIIGGNTLQVHLRRT